MTKKTKTGKKAGEKKFTVKLIIPPFSFRKKLPLITSDLKLYSSAMVVKRKICKLWLMEF